MGFQATLLLSPLVSLEGHIPAWYKDQFSFEAVTETQELFVSLFEVGYVPLPRAAGEWDCVPSTWEAPSRLYLGISMGQSPLMTLTVKGLFLR